MTRIAILAVLLITLSASTAHAAGVNLAWNDCGTAGVQNMTSPCTGSFGEPYVLIGSVVPPGGLGQVIGFTAILDIQVEGQSLPPWWELGEGCRRGMMVPTFDFSSGPFSCEQPWSPQGVVALSYLERDPSSNRAWIRMLGAVPKGDAFSVSPGSEYYLFRIALLRKNTSACEGCETPACIALTQVRLEQPAPLDDAYVTDPAHRSAVMWQGGVTTPDSDLGFCRADAFQSRTWGQVKSLYR